jgi:hypothetical protein
LFAAREFQPGQIVGFYVGNTIFTYPKRFTEQGSMEYLQYKNAILEDDTRTVTMLNKDGKLLDSNGTSMRSIDEDESSLYDLREGMPNEDGDNVEQGREAAGLKWNKHEVD